MEFDQARPSLAGDLPDLTPLIGPIAVIETERRLPAGPVAFAHAKIVNITSGRMHIRTQVDERVLTRGDTLVLGAGNWAQVTPLPTARTWTTCIDETFLRHHMSWAIPRDANLKQGIRPEIWDGHAVILRTGQATLDKLDPVLRRMSVLSNAHKSGEAAELIALFSRLVQISMPTLIDSLGSNSAERAGTARLVSGESTPVTLAVDLLRNHLSHPWDMAQLAHRVAISRSQLSRLFQRHAGIGPMRLLNEMRLTAFTRLIEETSLTVETAARQVGWDRRIALRRFTHRHGISPTAFRAQPHTGLAGESPCLLCPGRSCARSGTLSEGLF